MGKIGFKQIPDKSKLLHLGIAFKDLNREDGWKVSSYFQGEETNISQSLDVSLLPVLALRRKFDRSKKGSFKAGGYETIIKFPASENWSRKPMKSWPNLPAKWKNNEVGDQVCFYFESNSTKVWLPTFELARVLFFPASYLARTAFEPNGLDLLFNISGQDDETIQIQALPGSNIPTIHFDLPVYRKHLAWLLLDEQIKALFDSIYSFRNKKAYRLGNNLRWNFNFSPPSLENCVVKARGWYVEETDMFLVFEILNLKNIEHNVRENIEFLHPNNKERVSGERTTKGGIFVPEPEGVEVDLEEDPSSNNHHYRIDTPPIGLYFNEEINTQRIYTSKKQVDGGRPDESVDGGKTANELGVQEGIESGTNPQADFDQLKSDENTNAYKNKFVSFEKMLVELAKHPNLTLLSKIIRPLPRVGRCRMHLLESGTPRCYMHARFKLPNQEIRHVLEIDTSDGQRAMSTQILGFRNENQSENIINDLLEKTVKQSLRWHTATHKIHCDLFVGVSHPSISKIGIISNEHLLKWRDRFVEQLLS